MVYILKIILCSGLLLLVYFLFLEKEKMYRFNRLYLLFSIALSITVPFITFQIPKNSPLQTVNDFVLSSGNIQPQTIVLQKIPEVTNSVKQYNLREILMPGYWTITIFLLITFARNLLKMYSKIRRKKYISYNGSKLILIEENLTPHSFLNFIFLNKTAFEKETIEPEILCHELTHIKQRHTIDVLLIELVIVFFWFNPFIYLYRKAIKLNHEFLADKGVITRFENIRAYQYLLISKISQQKALAVTSQFNFSITKKRLIMITKNTSPKIAFMKYCLVMTVLMAAMLTFSTKSIVAQELKDTTHPGTILISKTKDTTKLFHFGNYAGGTKQGVTPKLLNEYQNIVNRTKTPEISWIKFKEIISEEDYKKLESIFMQMNLQQQIQQTVAFIRPAKPLPRIVPTQKQFEAFKNPKNYGVWINEKKIPNSELNNYHAKDFAQMFVSKLYSAAKRNKSYSYQVNLMTNDYYQAYYDRTIADKSNTMVFQGRRLKK